MDLHPPIEHREQQIHFRCCSRFLTYLTTYQPTQQQRTMDVHPPIEQREQHVHFRCCCLCLSALGAIPHGHNKRQGGPRSTGRRRAAPLAAVPVSDQARDPAAGSSPLPSSLATATTLPTRDESSRHSSAHVTARWRTNVMQSQCALLARGAGHCYQISSRHDPYTGLFARRRPGRPPNQAAASATLRQARQHGNPRPLAAVLVVDAMPCSP